MAITEFGNPDVIRFIPYNYLLLSEGWNKEQMFVSVLMTVAHEVCHLIQSKMISFRRGPIYNNDILARSFGIQHDSEEWYMGATIEDQAYYMQGIFLAWAVKSGYLNQDFNINEYFRVQAGIGKKNQRLIKSKSEEHKYGRSIYGHPWNEQEENLILSGYNSKNIKEEVKLLFGLI